VYILPEDGHRSGPKHVVVVHNKIEHEKHLLRTVVLIKVLALHKSLSLYPTGITFTRRPIFNILSSDLFL
jgi:hypothetical protein